MKVTEQTFITHLDNLPSVDIVDTLTVEYGFALSEIFQLCVGDDYEFELESFKERNYSSSKCDVCCEYFTEPEDLNEQGVCEDCVNEFELKQLGVKER